MNEDPLSESLNHGQNKNDRISEIREQRQLFLRFLHSFHRKSITTEVQIRYNECI